MNPNLMRRLFELKGKQDAAAKRKTEVTEKINLLLGTQTALGNLQIKLQALAQNTQNKLQQRIVDIVQSCLDVVFPDEYKFVFEFVQKRGKTEIDMYLEKDGSRFNPMDSNGGGIVDVIAFALRVACLTIAGTEKILLLDEPFPHIRGVARERLGDVVSGLSKKLGMQVIMVGDVVGTGIKADAEFRVTKNNGVSTVTKLVGDVQ